MFQGSVESAAHIFVYDETMRMRDTLYLEIRIYSQIFLNTLED